MRLTEDDSDFIAAIHEHSNRLYKANFYVMRPKRLLCLLSFFFHAPNILGEELYLPQPRPTNNKKVNWMKRKLLASGNNYGLSFGKCTIEIVVSTKRPPHKCFVPKVVNRQDRKKTQQQHQ